MVTVLPMADVQDAKGLFGRRRGAGSGLTAEPGLYPLTPGLEHHV